MLVLPPPKKIVDEFGLRKIRDVKVKYANDQTQTKSVYCPVTLELKGKVVNFDLLAKVEASQPLVGQIVLEELDLVVDSRTPTLTPNLAYQEMPIVEIL